MCWPFRLINFRHTRSFYTNIKVTSMKLQSLRFWNDPIHPDLSLRFFAMIFQIHFCWLVDHTDLSTYLKQEISFDFQPLEMISFTRNKSYRRPRRRFWLICLTLSIWAIADVVHGLAQIVNKI